MYHLIFFKCAPYFFRFPLNSTYKRHYHFSYMMIAQSQQSWKREQILIWKAVSIALSYKT